MALRCQFIHNTRRTRGAVMIYALVFAITAAVTLYVASSIYQSRQKANALRAYNEQRVALAWDFQHILRSAYQNSLELGFGLADMEAWNTFLPVSSTYNYIGWGGTGSLAETNATQIANDLYNNIAGYPNSLWRTASALNRYQETFSTAAGNIATMYDSRVDMEVAMSTRTGGEFTASDMFTVPGWKPRRNNESGLAMSVDLHAREENAEMNHNFILFSSRDVTTFPDTLGWRTDLPFDKSEFRMVGAYKLEQTGYARWIRDSLRGRVEPSNDAMRALLLAADPEADVTKKGKTDLEGYIWAVEEPITNYQLILLDPENNGAWPGGNLAGNIKISDATLDTQVNRPKVLIWGNVDAGFSNVVRGGVLSWNIAGATNPVMPLAMVVNGKVEDASTDQFEWRIAKRSTQVSFGRASRAGVTPDFYHADLGDFLTGLAYDFYTLNTAEAERRLEVWNAQTSVVRGQKDLPTSSVNQRDFCYLNSVLSMSETGIVQWSAQSALSSNQNRMGSVMPSVSAFTLPYTPGSGIEYWVLKGPPTPTVLFDPAVPAEKPYQIELKYGAATNTGDITDPANKFDNYTGADANALGLSGIHYQGTLKPSTIITVDLARVGLRELDAQGDNNSPAITPRWKSPIEISLHNINPTAHDLFVYIRGDSSNTAANKIPVRIVVQGANEVRLIPDGITPGVGNYRRFILTSVDRAAMNLVLETSGLDYRWYGVLIAPYGLLTNCYSPASVVGATRFTGTAMGAGTDLIWHGTILARRFIEVQSGTLELRPDDGDGRLAGKPTDSNTTYSAFVPKYNGTIPLGRPVPLLVPRMVWTFE